MQHSIQQISILLSLLVIWGVFWSLKLTGITLAGEAFCGIDEHEHSELCAHRTTLCQLEECEPHTHAESCLLRELICELEEEPAHTHDESCLEKELICTLEETAEHTHSTLCYEDILICSLPEVPAHTHSEGCYELLPSCGHEEHTHSESCFCSLLTCGLTESAPHAHGEACFSSSLTCGLEASEDHAHNDACYSTYLICDLKESPGHSHEEACFASSMTCTAQEHIHENSCFTSQLTCTLEETRGHRHEEGCFNHTFICTEEETPGHAHTDECYVCIPDSIVCGLEETEGHTHGEECYRVVSGFICELTEAEGHVHTAECLSEETLLDCGVEAREGHTHTEECFNPWEGCPLEVHIHDESCYSDVSADLETSDDWETLLSDLEQTGSTAENVISVAVSQLGYTESTRNFQVDDQGVRRGITRYGQWYGNPYGDWSAMFLSFCLHYGGAEDLPANAGAESMRLEWDTEGLYRPAELYIPKIGDLVFLKKVEDDTEVGTDTAAYVAIITAIAEDSLTLIQGDWLDSVAERTVEISDPAILGYGLIPEASPYVLRAAPTENLSFVAQAIDYSANIFTGERSFILYTERDGVCYAIDSNANAVPVLVNDDGSIYSDAADPNSLLWTFTYNYSNNNLNYYYIANVSTGIYLHPYQNSPNDGGILLTNGWGTPLTPSGTGVKLIHSASARLNADATAFEITANQNEAATFYFGYAEQCSVWLDGSGGDIDSMGGSQNQRYEVVVSSTLTLPEEWPSPTKYSYKLRGWYDITHDQYYAPGEQVTIEGDTVFYADWIAATYDIGYFNGYTVNTVSTNSFITNQLFDYNYLFNVLSADSSGTISDTEHSETWSIVQNGTVDYEDRESLNFIFLDYGDSGTLEYPNNRIDGLNQFPGSGIVTSGIYNSTIGSRLFTVVDNIPGKHYLGTADHLFQIEEDPNDPYYGYYYYDSAKNAASYNQSAGRFYVYEYLEATSAELTATKSDFLPLNSPYANTNGQQVGTYVPDGDHARFTNYVYDAKYDSSGNSVDRVSSNYAFGMKMDIRFYLPNHPGEGGNKDLYGSEMRFIFSGDDDLWVLVDGKLALDIGGIHQAETGEINFSTGEVLVQGARSNALSDVVSALEPGEHTLTVMYLERGGSHSNCAIYFNLAPRFSLNIQKEDALTQKLLDGTQFSIFEDIACTVPATLWKSQDDYNQGLPATNVFTIRDGTANIWGLGSGNTYYIKETVPPDAAGYGCATGLIRLTIGKEGIATYNADVIPDAEGNKPSNGFTVHGVKIDDITKTAYIVVTNAPETVTETTTVQVMKHWNDNLSHSDDYIVAYLTVTDPDGTVRQIREAVLSDENNWHYTWTNLPKYDYDAMTEIKYGILESYESGYYSTVRKISEIVISRTEWAEALSFQNGETYIIRTANGYLSTLNGNADTGYKWVSEDVAKISPYSLWTASVNGSNVKLTNGAGQIITFYYNGGSPTDFYATTNGPTNQSRQEFSYANESGGLKLYYRQNNRSYYLAPGMNSSSKFNYTTNAQNALVLNPVKKITQTDIHDVTDWAYQITNTPLAKDNETSLSVRKNWVIPSSYASTLYEQEQVTVRLLANGVNTGRTVTLTLKNGWSGTFQGLPYTDDNGQVIQYTALEVWNKVGWTAEYGEIITSNGSPPTYSVTITNTYHPYGPQLPSTGTAARMLYELSGLGIMLGSLVYGFGSRRKRERRTK